MNCAKVLNARAAPLVPGGGKPITHTDPLRWFLCGKPDAAPVAHSAHKKRPRRRAGLRGSSSCTGPGAASAASGLCLLGGLCRMSERHLTRTGRLIALCLLVAAVVMIGLAISGAFKRGPSPAPQLASQKK